MLTLPASLTAQYSIPFVIRNGMPMVQVEVNGEKGFFLVDSGANISAIDVKFATKSNVLMYGAQNGIEGIGGETDIMEVAGLKITIEGNVVKLNVKAVSLSHKFRAQGIIGSDWLITKKAKLDFKTKYIYINQ